MHLSRLQAPARAALLARRVALLTCAVPSTAFDVHSLNTASPILLFQVRHATHQAQGRANGAKDGPGKRLGAKKTGGEYVIPGNIIFRQRGTHWFPGENCAMGRDHTIFSTATGYVRYYKDPYKHPKRQYIGVVFDKSDTLPYAPHAARRRQFGMLAVKMHSIEVKVQGEGAMHHLAPGKTSTIFKAPQRSGRKSDKCGRVPVNELQLRPGYMYREANWQIGRAAERAGVKTKEYDPNDRFAAWRKATTKRAESAKKRGLISRKKK